MFKVGQRVIYNSDYTDGVYYPPKGTKGTITSILGEDGTLLMIKWDEGTDDGAWACLSNKVKMMSE